MTVLLRRRSGLLAPEIEAYANAGTWSRSPEHEGPACAGPSARPCRASAALGGAAYGARYDQRPPNDFQPFFA